jgi:protein TonB
LFGGLKGFRLPVALSLICHAAAFASIVWLGLGDSAFTSDPRFDRVIIPLRLVAAASMPNQPMPDPEVSIPVLAAPAEHAAAPTEAAPPATSPAAKNTPLPEPPEADDTPEKPRRSAIDAVPDAAAPQAARASPSTIPTHPSKREPANHAVADRAAERPAARTQKPAVRPNATQRRETARATQATAQPPQTPVHPGEQQAMLGDAATARPPAAAATAPPASAASAIDAEYRRALSVWLERNKVYPDTARQRGEEGSAVLRFRVDRYGRVLSYQLTRSTGFTELDAAVDRMVRGATLPPFPASMTQSEIAVSVPIRFSLSR